MCLTVVCPAVDVELRVAPRCGGEGGSITGVPLDRTSEEIERLGVPVLCKEERRMRECAQVKIVGGEVVCRPFRHTPDLGRLQRRFDDAGDAERDLVLEFEHTFERAVEAVGPQM